MKTWLVIDVSFLCHRAFHTAQHLLWKEKPTGVIFGFLKSISFLKDEFQTDRVAFCFEHPDLFRKAIYPPYKSKRRSKERTEAEKKSYQGLNLQIAELRGRYLPRIGFKNIFCYRGMESDDIMAAIAMYCTDEDNEIILVTADSDLYQCLSENMVMIYSPQARKLLTEKWFVSKYGIVPSQWAVVKAIAGCSTDEIKGVGGVGELTALKYLRGELKESDRAYKAIRSRESLAIVRRNRILVKLPFHRCPIPHLQEDKVSSEGWRSVCSVLGMRSIAEHPPIATRKRRSLCA